MLTILSHSAIRVICALALSLAARASIAQQSPPGAGPAGGSPADSNRADGTPAAESRGDLLQSIRARIDAARKPNIIFILADDLGYGEVGCYGQKQIQTPNIDRLAAEGMRFTRCYAGTTVCAPSRAALMTGLHTGHVSIRGNAPVSLLPNEVTVAQVLKQAGYDTACFGKWGLGQEKSTATPSRKGFDEWFGYLDQTHAHDYYPTQLWRSSTLAGVDDLLMPLLGNQGGAKGDYAQDLFTKAATNFIRVSMQRPFFLYLPYTIPHAH